MGSRKEDLKIRYAQNVVMRIQWVALYLNAQYVKIFSEITLIGNLV